MKKGLLFALCAAAACAKPVITRPAEPSVISPPISVNASFDRTWDATVSWFAERNIAIKTIDKSSGLIVATVDGTNLMNAPAPKNAPDYKTFLKFADCGKRDGVLYNPTSATYNVHVLKVGANATFQANVKYEQDGSGVGNRYYVCVSTGAWESDIQSFVKSRAEKPQ